jgi:hypothetical protein
MDFWKKMKVGRRKYGLSVFKNFVVVFTRNII